MHRIVSGIKIKSTFSSLGFIKKTAVHEKDIGNAEKNAQKERTDFSIPSFDNPYFMRFSDRIILRSIS